MKKIDKLAIVDDDEAFVFLTREIVEETDMVNNISVFGNGLDALNFIQQNKNNSNELPEIILLDLNMPVMDGWQFLERYCTMTSELAKPIAVYICTSSISPDDVAKAREISAVSDYIVKPVTTDNLKLMISGLKN
jgi:CheY-like chemotaxis protein